MHWLHAVVDFYGEERKKVACFTTTGHHGNFSAKPQDDSTFSNKIIQDEIIFKDKFTVILH